MRRGEPVTHQPFMNSNKQILSREDAVKLAKEVLQEIYGDKINEVAKRWSTAIHDYREQVNKDIKNNDNRVVEFII